MNDTLKNLEGKKIFVAGKNGMVGSAILRQLEKIDCQILSPSRTELDLAQYSRVAEWFSDFKPDMVVLAAAKVGGILANDTKPVDFINDNLNIQSSVINASYEAGVHKLLFLGSSCIYPKEAPQPIVESSLLTGPLESTNEWYAIAKISGIKLCQAYMKQYGKKFISAMPTNLYGPNDNFDLNSSHVIPALLRKAHEAKLNQDKKLVVWGTGKPMREFLHVDDLAKACLFLLSNYEGYEHVNVGSGKDMTIEALAKTIMKVVGYEGELIFDISKPDGTLRKLMSNEKIKSLGWEPEIEFIDGMKNTYAWYQQNYKTIREIG